MGEFNLCDHQTRIVTAKQVNLPKVSTDDYLIAGLLDDRTLTKGTQHLSCICYRYFVLVFRSYCTKVLTLYGNQALITLDADANDRL